MLVWTAALNKLHRKVTKVVVLLKLKISAHRKIVALLEVVEVHRLVVICHLSHLLALTLQ